MTSTQQLAIQQLQGILAQIEERSLVVRRTELTFLNSTGEPSSLTIDVMPPDEGPQS